MIGSQLTSHRRSVRPPVQLLLTGMSARAEDPDLLVHPTTKGLWAHALWVTPSTHRFGINLASPHNLTLACREQSLENIVNPPCVIRSITPFACLVSAQTDSVLRLRIDFRALRFGLQL
jgi:hypothetical protein